MSCYDHLQAEGYAVRDLLGPDGRPFGRVYSWVGGILPPTGSQTDHHADPVPCENPAENEGSPVAHGVQ